MSFLEKNRKTLIPIIAAVALIIVIIAVVSATGSVELSYGDTPSVSFAGVFEHLREETGRRIASSPLPAAGMLLDTLENGTVTVDFDYRNRAIPFVGNVSGRAALFSDALNHNYALEAAAGLMGGMMNIDFEAHLNSERFALRSSLMGSDFYGFTHSSFREDIQGFGPLIGLDAPTMEQMADFVELIAGHMSNDAPLSGSVDYAPYLNLLTEFIGGLEYTVEDSELLMVSVTGTETIAVTEVNYFISHEDILVLLADLYSVLEEDTALRSFFYLYNNPLIQGLGMLTYDELLANLQSWISFLEHSASLEILLTFLINADDRLTWLGIHTSREDGALPALNISISADFGHSVYDMWRVDVIQGAEDVFSFSWSFYEASDGFENILDVTYSGPFSNESHSLTSLWSPEDGAFTLSYDNWLNESINIAGTFLVNDDDGFLLRLDGLNIGPTETLTLEITTAPGAEISPVDFIPMSLWGQSVVDMIGFVSGLLF